MPRSIVAGFTVQRKCLSRKDFGDLTSQNVHKRILFGKMR